MNIIIAIICFVLILFIVFTYKLLFVNINNPHYENYIKQIKQRKLAIQKDILENNERLEIEYEFYLDKSWECSEEEYTTELHQKYYQLTKAIDSQWYEQKYTKNRVELIERKMFNTLVDAKALSKTEIREYFGIK